MRYIIIEDEEIARENIQDIIIKIRPNYQLISTLESVEESIKFLEIEDVDLIFMDIDLGDGNCFDILEHVDVKVPIIFTTAYNDYALEAFKVHSIDYLLKPIVEDDVMRALEKLESMTEIFNPSVYKELVPKNREVQRILICGNKTFSYLNISDIAFFCVEDRYIMAYSKEGKNNVTEMKSMEEVMSIVYDHDFFQLSRSVVSSIQAIVHVKKIDNQRLQVTVCAGEIEKEAIISSLRRTDFLNWLGR
ncbi:MAG: ypdB 3 [Bacteroidetes bacterium]|nr:ypdB 3 [Bacteroidota bacterium]MBP1677685.1 ypdB 3 [Bacteroidota bacterium]